MEKHQIEIEGGSLPAFVSGSGKAILFIHGWACDHRMWDYQRAIAKLGFQVISYDRRGFGDAKGSANLQSELIDIIKILQYFSIEYCTLVGMSQGGRVALRFAFAFPEYVSALMLQGAPIDGFPSAPSASEAIPLEHFSKLLRSGEKAQFAQEWLDHPIIKHDVQETDLVRKMVEDYQGRDILSGEPDQYAQDIYKMLPTLDIPCAYIVGGRETDYLKNVANQFVDRVPKAKQILINDAGHFSNITHSALFNESLVNLVRNGGERYKNE